MNPLDKMPLIEVAGDKATCIIASQNTLFELVERKVKRLAVEKPRAGFTHRRVERTYSSPTVIYDKVELTVECSCRVTLNFEANRPSGDFLNEVQCKVGIFQKNRHRRDTKLEDHVFFPNITAQGVVMWRDQHGINYTPQQLCEFAFQRFFSIHV